MAQIKKDTSLRKAILQAAITGQLISNVEGTTETGKQLLDKIIEERNNKLLADWGEALKKNPKVKKPAPVVASEIDEDEIPFEIPENWCWCRLGDLVPFGQCENADPNDIKEDAWILDLEDIEKNSGKILQFKTKKEVDSKSTKHIFRKDYVLYSKLRPYLNKCVIAPKDGYCTSEILPLDFGKHVFNKYAQKFLMSPYFVDYTDSLSFGVKMPRLGTEDGKKALVPLPPLSVQNAIVAKLEQVLPLVDAYENALLQKEELKSALPDKIKKAILQEAITGKLTENWRKSATIKESGKQLLDRIIEERNAKALAEWEEALKKNPKAKKPVPVVAIEIDEEEIPFEVPESWCWCHLGEVCNEIKRGKSPKYVDRSDYLAFAQKCNVKTGGIDLSLALYLDEKSIDRYSEEDNLIQGDVVINSTGGGTMGRVGYYETKVPKGIKGVYPDSHVTVIRSVGNINQRYLYYILKHNQPVLEDCGTGSTNQTELKPAVLANFVIPLPPLEEQEEIVKKVEELLPLCK